MVRCSTAPVDEVVAPKPPKREPGHRTQIAAQYRAVLHDAVVTKGEALVVTLEPEDKLFTIRNRMLRAATDLGIERVKVGQRGNRLIAYQEEAPEREADAEEG